MKKIFLVSVVCLLMMAFTVSIAVADEAYTFKLSYSPSENLAVGDVITVTFDIVSDAGYKMYMMQNEVLFDREYFELVAGSITVAAGFSSGTRDNTQDTGSVVMINFADMSRQGVDRPAQMFAGSFQLKIIKPCQDIKIINKDFFLTDAEANDRPVTAGDITVNAAAPVTIKTPPALGSEAITLGSNAVISFTDDATWRAAIQDVKIDGESKNYTAANGSITLAASLFPAANSYIIRVIAAGYEDAVVIQKVNAASGGGTTPGGTTPGGTTPGGTTPIIDLGDDEVPLALVSAHIRYIFGYEDGSFGPEKNITRAEVAAIFSRLIDYTAGDEGTYTVSFSDVPVGAWYYDAVAYLEHYKILSGYPDGTFRPNDFISRAEFAKVAALFESLSTTVTNTFPDVKDSHWAASYILSSAAKGWINGFPDGTFRPDEKVTRAQVVAIVNRMQERKIEKADIPATALKFPDVLEAHWAYADIIEASSEHTFTLKGNGYEIWDK